MPLGDVVPPAPGEVVVCWSPPTPWRSLVARLDPIEVGRVEAYVREDDRDRFATGAWLFRSLVGAVTDTDPGALDLSRSCRVCGEPHGRPVMVDGPVTRASVTHGGGLVGVALAGPGVVGDGIGDGDGIGLDVEPVSASSSVEELRHQVIGPRESSEGDDGWHPPGHGLLWRWVVKEAALKAAGVGLQVDPADVVLDTSGPADDPVGIASWPLPIDPGLVRVDLLRPDDDHVAALAVLATDRPAVRVVHTTTS